MAGLRRDEEELFGDEEGGDEDPEEGEDLMENMAADYVHDPEQDRYDPDMLDDGEHEPLTMAQRRAAEMEMDQREARTPLAGRRRPRAEFASPERDVLSPSMGSDLMSPMPRRRRLNSDVGDGFDVAADTDLPEDLPEAEYTLTQDNLDSENGGVVQEHLRTKIQKNFQQFLLKFCVEGQTEPKYPPLFQIMAEENEQHLEVNYMHLQTWSPTLGLWLSEHPKLILPLLNQTLMREAKRKYATYREMGGEESLRVAVHSFPVKEQIRELCTKHIGKLVTVQGVITKRSQVYNQVKLLYLNCAHCNLGVGPFYVSEGDEFQPKACLECGAHGPWKVDRGATIYRNHQKVTMQEAPGSVEPGKMPRSKEVILSGDLVDMVRPGDELVLTGVYVCKYDVEMNARTCWPVFKTELEAVHCLRKGDVKSIHMTDEQVTEILKLAETDNIRERIINSIAPSIYGMNHVKTAIALAMLGGQSKHTAGKHRIRGDINVLIVGDPGLAKSQFLKYIEQTFPRAVYTTGKGASAVGLTAAVQRDPESGNFVLEGGAMVLADNGMCLIDEFDKMNDKDRTSIHEAMEQQTISISKAGIVASLHARCSVVAVANPTEGRYDARRSFAENVNLSDPILSRFDILCVLRDESDPVQDERLADHVICSHIKAHPDATAQEKDVDPRHRIIQSNDIIDHELLTRYIVYARTKVKPSMSQIDKEKVGNFYKDIRAQSFRSGGAPMTARHVDSIMRMAEASARLELRNTVKAEDLDFAIGVMLESFIQSQKHQVAEELRQKFRRYITKATPVVDQIYGLLNRLIGIKAEQLRLARRPNDVNDVFVTVHELVQQIEINCLDMDEVRAFMGSDRFHLNFRLEDERIYRLL